MSNDVNLIGLAAATRARNDANIALQEADEQRHRAMMAEQALRNTTTDQDLQRKVKQLGSKAHTLSVANEELRKELDKRDALINEWMHGAEAFRRLAKQYGKDFGFSDEKVKANFDAYVLEIAAEDTKFAQTNLAINTKASGRGA